MTEQEDRFRFIEWLKDLRDTDGMVESAFGLAVELRLIWGEKEFGNKSFKKRADDLANEVAQECFDIPAWTHILRQRLKSIEPNSVRREHALGVLDQVCKDAFAAWTKLERIHNTLVEMEEDVLRDEASD